MALSCFRLRRALSLSSTLLKLRPISSMASLSPPLQSKPTPQNPRYAPSRHHNLSLRPFSARSSGGPDENIGSILFEGCDYNHWLITMAFPEPKPSPEEMVETYVQTLAKVVGSVEEAKKSMYACSTTTYEGFQCVMSEEMSRKFEGLPGVVFILPDSYIDPVNKEYGGDKYDNGVITPRPPPIQYGRQGRYWDRNRNNDRQSFNRPQNCGPQGQDGRGYGPPGQEGRGYNAPVQDGRSYGPPGQEGRGYNSPGQGEGGLPHVDRRDLGQGERRDYAQTGRGNYAQGGRDYASGRRDGYQGERRDSMPSYQVGYNQGAGGNAPQDWRNVSQSSYGSGPYGGRDHRQGTGSTYNANQGQGGSGFHGGYGQGMGSGYSDGYRQGTGAGYNGGYGQGTNSGYRGGYGQGTKSGYGGGYMQGTGTGYGQTYTGNGQRPGMQDEQGDYSPTGQTGTNQGRH
ncbi:hypothetical protein QJS10_CPA08g01272 [Acorus calamus]|uniref:MORF/ORRM1/DAG-like MORF domain-containing protein n=1 Tax=Acorus calamus TaxID=4465 RepID=A0AAV9EE43_ACOCL|nr:hypothetical protein QJS10_CPA08g01272 [Acorus calamus]